jgi:hypothetical protein
VIKGDGSQKKRELWAWTWREWGRLDFCRLGPRVYYHGLVSGWLLRLESDSTGFS